MLMRTLYGLVFLLITLSTSAQLTELTVEKIMRDPKWIGTAPSNLRWSPDSKTLYFTWNPEKAPGDSLYKITLQNRTPQKVNKAERSSLPGQGTYNNAFTKMVYEKNGDIFLLDVPIGKTTIITNTTARESNPYFSGDEKRIIYSYDQNLCSINTGNFSQLTDFKRGRKPSTAPETEQQKWLKQDQLVYIEILKERKEKGCYQYRKTESLNVRKKFT